MIFCCEFLFGGVSYGIIFCCEFLFGRVYYGMIFCCEFLFGGVSYGIIFCCEFLFGRCLRPWLLRAHYIRLLLRNEPSPAYPYRIFYYMLYHNRLSRLKGCSVLLTFRLKNQTCEARKTATAKR